MQGTIPYLGTFLTDLVMLDTAMKDFLDVRTSVSILQPLSFLHPGIPTAWSGKWGQFPVHLTLPPCVSYIQRFLRCPISSAAPCASHTQRCPCASIPWPFSHCPLAGTARTAAAPSWAGREGWEQFSFPCFPLTSVPSFPGRADQL